MFLPSYFTPYYFSQSYWTYTTAGIGFVYLDCSPSEPVLFHASPTNIWLDASL